MMQLDSVSLNRSLSVNVLIDKFQGRFFQMRSHLRMKRMISFYSVLFGEQ